MRCVVTAREQVQMLTPWRLAGYQLAPEDDPELTRPTKLYRGIAVHSVPPEQQQRWGKLLDYAADDSDLGRHFQVGPEIIQHLHDRQGGVGRHWTTNPARAHDFAGRNMEVLNKDLVGSAFPAVLEMDWDGRGLDLSHETGMNSPAHNFQEDDERVLQHGHQGTVSGVKVNESSLGGMVDVLNPPADDHDFGHLHRPGYAHPVQITGQSTDAPPERTAALREATPWYSKPGDPTYRIPTQDLVRHRQFNPAITTPEQYRDSVWTDSYDPKKEPYRNNFTNNWSSGGGSEGSNEEDIVEALEKGHKLPPVEVVTNGVGATLADGNHRTEVADMMSHPELESYIHYDPHRTSDDLFEHQVDPSTELGRQIHKLVQNHPYEPVEGGPTTDHVFRRHPETGEWQRGKLDHSTPPHFVDTPEYAKQMQHAVPGFKNQGLGTYFNVDFGNGPEITHERHLHANWRTAANDWDIRHSAGRDSGVYSAHDPVTGEKAAHLMYRTYTDDDGTPTFLLNGIHTDSAYQRQGLATTLLQRLHDDHPDHRVDPGPRSDEGDAWWQHLRAHQPGFSEWTKNSPKSLRDNLRGVLGPPQPIGGGRTAMANSAPWHPHIELFNNYDTNDDGREWGEGEYWCRIPDESQPSGKRIVGQATYEYDGPNLKVHTVSVNPRLKGRGIGQALIERMHADHPHRTMNPGETTTEGSALTQRLMETTPDAQSKVDPEWQHSPLPPRAQRDWLNQQNEYWDRRSKDWDSLSQSDIGKQLVGWRQEAMADHWMEHRPPGPHAGFPMHDITQALPEDMYHNLHYWSGGGQVDSKEVLDQLNQVRGNPEAPVNMYRALPHGNTDFHTGDWVTTSLTYAREHAMHPDDPAQDMPVLKSTVPAKHLWGNGDMLQEFGYHGPSHAGTVI